MQAAPLENDGEGLKPTGDGWFVVNARDAAWREHTSFGRWCGFEGSSRFPQFGVNIHTLAPGQPACSYHRENAQECFLVLAGECLLIVESQERALGQGDFVYCPPETEHVFVGAGDGPCTLVMIGHRPETEALSYPANPVAARHGASVGSLPGLRGLDL